MPNARKMDLEAVERRVKALPNDALAEVVLYAFGGLYVEHDDKVNPDKQVSGADYIEHMAGILRRHGLTPE